MKDRYKGMVQFNAIEILIVIVVLTAQGILQTGIGIILAMFGLCAMIWIAINDRQDEDEDIQDEDEI
jgi:hypothetical protein